MPISEHMPTYGDIFTDILNMFVNIVSNTCHVEDVVDIVGRFSGEDFFPNATGRLVDRFSGIVARRVETFAKLDAFSGHQGP